MTSSGVIAEGAPMAASPSHEVAETLTGSCRPPLADTLTSWEREIRQFAALLHDERLDTLWLDRLHAAFRSQAALTASDPDTALYVLLQAAASVPNAYSAHHSMLCAVACGLCSRLLGWSEGDCWTLQSAALSMNVSMASLQDTLAQQAQRLTAAQREKVAGHAERSAVMLADAGVTDAAWLGTVRAHHGAVEGVTEPAARMGALLQRVDVYTAKLSRRASREPMTPALAARQTCLDENGRPDALGSVLLRAMGVYPPGCCVELSSGELGIVTRRGAKAHTPIVAAVRRADGGLFMPPVRRDTSRPTHGIASGRTVADLNVHIDHERTLMCA